MCSVCGMHKVWATHAKTCKSPVCKRMKRMELNPQGARRIHLRYSSIQERHRAKTLYVAFRRDGKEPIDALTATATVMRVSPEDALFMLRDKKKAEKEIHPEVEQEYRVEGRGEASGAA